MERAEPPAPDPDDPPGEGSPVDEPVGPEEGLAPEAEAPAELENRVVAHLLDGTLVKGHTWNFAPNKPRFHVFPVAPDEGGEPVEVWFRDLKALFFVRDFAGSPEYEERKAFAEAERAPGHTLEVTFVDGEVLVGSTTGYDPQRLGFFLFPVDDESNNLRIFIVSAAVRRVRRV
jgi:hypothetical protein